MTVSNGKSVEQVLTELENAVALNISSQGMRGEAPKRSHAKALAALEEIMVAAKPEKRELAEPVTGRPVSYGDKVTVDVEADPKGSLIFVQNNGFNMALNQYEQNIRQAFSKEAL